MLSSLMEPLRRRAAVAFGKEQTTSFNRITPREQEILEQLTLGRTVRDIAAGLSRSPHTVHDHVKSLHRKLQATSRGELIARYLGHIKSCGDTAPAGPAGPGGDGEAAPQAAKPQVVTRIDQQAGMRATA